MIKEVIQAQIDLLVKFSGFHIEIQKLEEQKLLTKSIEDIKQEEYQRGFTDAMNQYKQVMLDNMEKAFEAGGDLMDDRGLDVVYQYKTFEDYLKRNGIK